jgi:hypothetical protein
MSPFHTVKPFVRQRQSSGVQHAPIVELALPYLRVLLPHLPFAIPLKNPHVTTVALRVASESADLWSRWRGHVFIWVQTAS